MRLFGEPEDPGTTHHTFHRRFACFTLDAPSQVSPGHRAEGWRPRSSWTGDPYGARLAGRMPVHWREYPMMRRAGR